MSKSIVIFHDGTWNKPDEPDADAEVCRETNVCKLYEMCVNDERTQVAYYDQGVGTHWYDRRFGGVAGVGLSENIGQAYHELARRYEPGDKG
ncbi:MAG: DUF2235 domain-containing protein [Candidatus Competibacteraceae bacterium]